jgi:DNA-binding NtrC family response regulator
MDPFTIFLVDDEESIRQGVYFGLKNLYRVKPFPSAEEALKTIRTETPDLVLLDIGLPGMNGIDALKEIKAFDPNILIIMISAYEDIKTVISAMKKGAHDYVIKPIHIDSLRVTIKKALDTVKLRKEIQTLQEKSIKENLPCFIGESNAIQDMMQFVTKVAQSPDTPILIVGESGTGKELVARAVHYKSPIFNGPFVTLNCAAIPRDLVESELFGYEKGAFSGASASGKSGLIEQAADGTLFLDEIGDLSLEAQAKLLRFLEDGEYYRVGGTQKLRVQTRIVSATNKDLNDSIEKGVFRLDLFYRLGVIKVQIPSLNQRREDIIRIAKYFLVEFGQKHEKTFEGISTDAENFLVKRQWKGNIRELRNFIERGVLVGNGPDLTLNDLGVDSSNSSTNDQASTHETEAGFPPLPDDGIDLNALEEYFIREALNRAEGNDAKAAQLLKMSYYSYRYRKKKIKDLTESSESLS